MKKFFIFLLIVIAVIIAYNSFDNFQSKNLEPTAETEEVIKTFSNSIKSKADTTYNLEETIRIVHGLENSKQFMESSSDYLKYLAKQDYSNVANEVIEAKKGLIPILNKLQRQEKRLENVKDLWKTFNSVSNIMLNEGSSLALKASISGGLDPSMLTNVASISQQSFRVIAENKKIENEVKDVILDIEDDYINYLNEFYPIYLKYMKEWDKICLIRDNAYLSISQGNIDSALLSLDKALKLNQSDSESLIMKAFSHLYLHQNTNFKNSENLEYSHLETAKVTIDKYLKLYPEKSAPALLLLGSYYNLNGEENKAITYYNQSSVEYPRQANLLLDMLNSYKQRSYLRKTAEGMYILELYKSMMQGFGFFSPNFQKSLIAYNNSNLDESKEEIIRHFFRRGNQNVYDFLISDMNHCETYLPDSFNMIFKEKSFLNLVAETKMFNSDKLNIKIENNSDIKINNVRVFLCIHFTDMYKSDYEVFKLDNTINTIPAYSTADFGDLQIDFSLYGKEKSLDKDIVNARAIILTDNLISWVDAEDFKIIKAKKGYQNNVEINRINQYLSLYNLNDNKLNELIKNKSKLEINESYLSKDEIKISLPRLLVNFNPIFSINDLNTVEAIRPSKKILNGDFVELTFKNNVPEDKKISLFISTSKFILNWDFNFSDDKIILDDTKFEYL